MNIGTPLFSPSRLLAATCAVVANVLLLGGTLGLFSSASNDAVLAKATPETQRTAGAIAERAVPPKPRS